LRLFTAVDFSEFCIFLPAVNIDHMFHEIRLPGVDGVYHTATSHKRLPVPRVTTGT
jgi:hypothetical protein